MVFILTHIVSHLGHSLGTHAEKEPQRIYGLQEQIDHKVACFDQLKKENQGTDTQYILMGHSLVKLDYYYFFQRSKN